MKDRYVVRMLQFLEDEPYYKIFDLLHSVYVSQVYFSEIVANKHCRNLNIANNNLEDAKIEAGYR